MKTLAITAFVLCLGAFSAAASDAPPSQPTDRGHPGSNYYPFAHDEISLSFEGRTVTVFMPKAAENSDVDFTGKYPVIAFGHGHTVPLFAYRRTFQHLADKGIAVLNIDYDTGWFDGDFERMARDYSNQVQFALETYKDQLDAEKVIFSGHSNGGYTALLAAGLPDGEKKVDPRAVVVFAAAGAKSEYLARINPETVVTLVTGDQDSLASLATKIYDELGVKKKQNILLHSYDTSPSIKADHGLCRTSGWVAHSKTRSTTSALGNTWSVQPGIWKKVAEPISPSCMAIWLHQPAFLTSSTP